MHAKVGFLVAGTIKGGTTALCEALSKHPEICMPRDRYELHFFNRGTLFGLRSLKRQYDEYHGHFTTQPETKIMGEGTPDYMYWRSAPRRIWRYNPDMRLIFILRDPALRAYSHFMMDRRKGTEPITDFSRAIRLEKLRGLAVFPRQPRFHMYVDRGFYARQIKRLLLYFPRKQMLFLKSDELRHEHKRTINRVCTFLGLTPLDQEQPPVSFSTGYEPMRPEDRLYLRGRFARDVSDLERLLDWDVSEWCSA